MPVKKVQESRKPTRKLIAASIGSLVATMLIGLLASKGVDVSPEDTIHVNALIESLVYGLLTMLTALITGYFVRPGEKDGIKDES